MTEMNIPKITPAKWVDYAEMVARSGLTLMTWGPSGAGKSDLAAQLVPRLKLDSMTDIRLAIKDPSDLKGVPVPDLQAGYVRWLRDQGLPTDPNAKVLINFDERNQPSPIIQAMAYQLILDRKLGDYEIPKGCVIVAAGNRVSDRGVVSQMPAPLRSRMWHCELKVDVDDFCAWAVKPENDIIPELISFVRWKPDQLHDFEPDMTAYPTPRTIAMLSKLLKRGAPADMEFALAEGMCGRGFAIEYTGFLKVYRTLPNIKKILTDPDSVDVPTDPCTLYALASALARQADAGNMDNVIKFAKRLGREFQLLLLTDISVRDKKLGQNKSFIALNCELQTIASNG